MLNHWADEGGATMGTFLNRWTMPLLSVLRFVAGFLFIAHGTQKLFGIPVGMPGGPVPLQSLMGAAGAIEIVGGVLLLVGLLTRPAAFVLSGEMAVAYFMKHSPQSVWPIVNQGELAVLYCFLFLYFAAAGAGPWSLDALLFHRRSRIDRPDVYRPRAA
jgi:putative oxidoreductase